MTTNELKKRVEKILDQFMYVTIECAYEGSQESAAANVRAEEKAERAIYQLMLDMVGRDEPSFVKPEIEVTRIGDNGKPYQAKTTMSPLGNSPAIYHNELRDQLRQLIKEAEDETNLRVWDVAQETMHKVNHILFSDGTFEPERVYADVPGGQYKLQGKLDGGKEEAFRLMQYTGIKDINGQEIYEGDIIELKNGTRNPYEVLWNNSFMGWSFGKNGLGSMISLYDIDDFEVIGNIYENPKLLEKQEMSKA